MRRGVERGQAQGLGVECCCSLPAEAEWRYGEKGGQSESVGVATRRFNGRKMAFASHTRGASPLSMEYL